MPRVGVMQGTWTSSADRDIFLRLRCGTGEVLSDTSPVRWPCPCRFAWCSLAACKALSLSSSIESGVGGSHRKLLCGCGVSKRSSVIDSSAFPFPLWHLQIMRYHETGISRACACQEYYHPCSSKPFLLHTWPLQIWNVKTQPGAETKATPNQVAIGSRIYRRESFILGELWITRI